ncbi:MAG: methylenetetrahydrofolate--tRNA-(uracil(54)-C(5))-methyltransferase (FADH(2)-oxidizing) TrmFO [Myxococcota bacterium]|nr:methylenetetrahydrofolate--tRNA-(uracil(54)-C(5))-methyltransferase (FADH(2)-oxidizing) TrmFO [Myxococcota bacterium]
MKSQVTVIGGGLAGCEAAWQLAERGVHVTLIEMKSLRKTPAQTTDALAELVCSNSLRSRNPLNAVGLIKDEMQRLNSLIIHAAQTNAVPAGDALAVDREGFSDTIASRIDGHPNIERRAEVVTALPEEGPTIVATGPLTGDELAADIARATGRDRLYFYDAIAPIISSESINRDIVFAASRYGKGEGSDYLNCPLNKEEYDTFIDELLSAEYMPLHSFEKPVYFQGCQPIEVIAAAGRDSLRFGPMKPVGLTDPRTGKRPWAVVQLRQEDRFGHSYNLVGFQTKLKYSEQTRIFRAIPGLEDAQFIRLGAIHRNTYLDSPNLLDEQMRLRTRPHLRFAGQITGVEGYVESAAHGLLTAVLLAKDLAGQPIDHPPADTALGALWRHVTGEHRLNNRPHEPHNVNWSMFPAAPQGVSKRERKRYRVLQAIDAIEQWALNHELPLLPTTITAEQLADSPRPPRRKRSTAPSADASA